MGIVINETIQWMVMLYILYVLINLSRAQHWSRASLKIMQYMIYKKLKTNVKK